VQFPSRQPINIEDSPDDQQASEWTPPSYALSDNQTKPEAWKPPTYAIKAGESERDKEKKKHSFVGDLSEFVKSVKGDIGSAWDKTKEVAETPITHVIPGVKDLHPFNALSKMIDPNQGGTEGFGFNRPTASAFAEGVGSALEGFTSPINLGLMALSGGASLVRGAAARALPDIAELSKATTAARAANNPELLAKLTDELATARKAYGSNAAKAGIASSIERGAMGGIAANAASEGIKNQDPNQIAPFVMGVLGARGGAKVPKLAEELPIKQSTEMPYRMGGSVEDRPLNIKNTQSETTKANSNNPPLLPDYAVPSNPTEAVTPQSRLESYIKNNPDAKMNDIAKFIEDVNQTTNVEPRKSTLGIEDVKAPISQERKPFINPFEKAKPIINEQEAKLKEEFLALNKQKEPIVDETSRPIAPVQEELPTELPKKAPGTEFVADTPGI